MKKWSKRNVLMTSLSAALILSALTPAVSSVAPKKLTVKKVTVVNNKTIAVDFSGPVNKSTALKSRNYVFAKNSGLSVTKVTLSGNKALLTIKGVEKRSASFKVGFTVLNVKDNKGKVM
jgi:hypothetical protein